MEDLKIETVDMMPRADHDAMMARLERANHRLFVVLCIVSVGLILVTGFCIYRETQFEDVVTETYTAETDSGGTAVVNGDGTVTINGESDLHEDKTAR